MINIKLLQKIEKYWFAIDGKSILSNDNDSLTINSFSQLKELYEIEKQIKYQKNN